jgi:hypothetical protein
MIKQTDKESFSVVLVLWYEKWKVIYKEQKLDKKGKKRYVHRRLRSTNRRLKNNLDLLFMGYDNMELGIPNTTNKIDGHFADVKNKLSCHNGCHIKRKKKFIDEFF